MMNDKLREYIDALFAEAPPSKKTVEIKEEILQNLQDKYDDLLATGKSEEAAYNLAIAGLGDFSQFIEELKGAVKPTATDRREGFRQQRQRRALLTSIAVMLYIVCIVPTLLFQNEAGPVLMFVMAAAATGILIYSHMSRPVYQKHEDTLAEEFIEWRESNSQRNQLYKSINAALWPLTVVVYLLVSFWTHAWHVTWMIFLITAALSAVIRAIFDWKR